MPLHGKIVVIKRSGGDGTEFPLTATCLFGRRPDCDIRIQLPQVSKEHCRIDLNENKEIILTNLSSVNPTCVNGEALQQSERLKHGDVITIIDRSFRFEYPPAPTPKKRSSIGGKTETLKVLQDQQVGDTVNESGEKRISEVSTDPHLKDGTNHDNIQRSLEKTVEVEAKEDDGLLQSKTVSPFSDLYQMIKKSLDVKTPRKSSASVLQTPTSRFCTPRLSSVRKNDGTAVISTEDKSTPKKGEAKVSPAADETKEAAEHVSIGTPKSVKKQRRSFQTPSTEMERPEAATSEATSPQKRNRTPPQRFTAGEVIEQITATPKSRRSKEAKAAVTPEQEEQASPKIASLRKASPRNSGKVEKVKETSKKRKSEELGADLPAPQIKKKRVSFGGFLCPELFDKRLPPNSPLCKGASPRRSLCASKPKQSLLRRASVIGLIHDTKEHPDSPAKMSTPSPQKSSSSKGASPKAATPAKKAPKSRSPSPKAATPAKKAPKSRSPSPKAATPAKNAPKSKSPSPARGTSATVSGTPGVQTPKIQGRFSVSHISTPSPVSEDVVTDLVPLVTATPKVPLRRRSASRGTPSLAKSAAKIMRRRSGISRASLKVKNSWADIVKFGQTKPQVVAPAKKTVTKKTTKKTVSKPQTPARKLKGHVSTGHADSPVTIVVGRAHKQKVVHPTGAAPRLVPNIALLKKNMKMDEDLTGISEMLKTPVNERKRKSVINATKTPVSTSVIEPSVLNTPEEPGEMMVSPLSVSSAVKDRSYNSEAVQRLLNDDKESSFVSDTPALELRSHESSQQLSEFLKTTSVTTPKQKPERQECLTGVKRMMKTPRQKAEPVEDLRGRLLKTPKQKPEQQECLTGVKRMMKTPRQKAEPVEDLRGRLLKTPKQKPEQQECLTGVKRMMETPRREAEPVEDIKVELLATLEQKPEQEESHTSETTSKTPQQEAEPHEDLLETPKALEAGDVSLDDVKELVETPADVQESEDTKASGEKSSLSVPCSNELTDIKTITKAFKEKGAPVEDMVGVKRLMKTPREKGKAVEENFGIKRLVQTPRPSSNAPVEDFEGLTELMEEPLAEPTGQLETNEVADQTPQDCTEDVAKELDFAPEEPQDDVTDDVPQVEMEKELDANEVVTDEHLEEVPTGSDNNEHAMETISHAAVEETVSEEQPKEETAAVEVTEMAAAATDSDHEKKPVRGRRAKTVECKSAEDKQEAAEHCEEPVVSAPVRGRRGKKTEATAPPAVRQTTRGRNAKSQESTSDDQPETEPEKAVETTLVAEISSEAVSEHTSPIEENDSAPPAEEAVVKPVRGRKTKPETKQQQQPPVRAKRGRNAKQEEEEKPESAPVETTKSQEPATKQRRTRKTEQDHASADQDETVQEVATEAEMVAEPEVEQSPPADVDHEANASAAPLEKAVPKPKRGRKPKQAAPSVPEQKDGPSDDVPQADTAKEADTNEVCSDQQEAVTSGSDENKSSDAMETVTESLPEAVTVPETAIVQKKSVRGRRAKTVECKSAEDKQEAAEHCEEPVVSAPVRGRRGKKTEATAPPAVRQTTRGRNAKSQESTSDDQPETEPEKTVETTLVAEISSEAVSEHTSPVEENDSAPPAEEAVVKPVRGRKTKPETKQQHQPPVRAKRGRNAKQEEEEKPESAPVETTKSQEPATKQRRTRKAEQDHVEEEVQAVEVVVVEAEAPLVAEPEKITEVTVAAKPRRGGRKAKQDTESETAAESTAVSSTDKVKRGRRGKQVTEEVEVTAAENPDHELEAEEENNAEPDTPVIKPSRARGAKTSVKNEVIPAKRARRGAALPLEETKAESAVVASEPASTSVEPAKRGRRAAAKPIADDATVANPTEDVSGAAVEEAKKSKRSVKWKADLDVFEIPKATPVKAVRGRKSKLDTESKNDADKTEENDLSGKVAEAQPVKRARRGAKVADVTADEAESTSKVTNLEADAQPKTRRGRPTKK